jgi:hypothetical protein
MPAAICAKVEILTEANNFEQWCTSVFLQVKDIIQALGAQCEEITIESIDGEGFIYIWKIRDGIASDPEIAEVQPLPVNVIFHNYNLHVTFGLHIEYDYGKNSTNTVLTAFTPPQALPWSGDLLDYSLVPIYKAT